MTWLAGVNDNTWLYRGADGREAWVFIKRNEATIVTDIHGAGAPGNAVAFTIDALREIIRRAENTPE